jgi:hypothetical protein
MYKLFLDDIRDPIDCTLYKTKHMSFHRSMYAEDWTIVRSYDEFVKTVEMNFYADEWPSIVSFDHDLADEHYDLSMYNGEDAYPLQFAEKTGTDCAKWLLQFCIKNNLEIPECYVHSMNPIGAERIKNVLDDWKKYKELKEKGKI